MGLIGLAVIVLNYVAKWFLFNKAGEEGWKSLIPFYNNYIYCKIGNCIKLFWADLILSLVVCSGVALFVINMMVTAFGSILGINHDNLSAFYSMIGLSIFTLVIFAIIGFGIFVAKTVLSVLINLKVVSCFTDETVFKVLAGIGSFSPFYVALVVTRCILAFDEKYKYVQNVEFKESEAK